MKFRAFLCLLILGSNVNAYNDERRYSNTAPYRAAVYEVTRQIGEGAKKGDFIRHPTIFNITGNFLVNFTPLAPVADSRDLVANFKFSLKTGFKEYKKDVAFSLAGFIPIAGEAKKIKQAYEAGKQAKREGKTLLDVLNGTRYVTKALPKLDASLAQHFDGPILSKTLKKGTKIYRAPNDEIYYESAKQPGRWLGMTQMTTVKMAQHFYSDNSFRIMRTYVLKKDVTVYAGKVKGGSGTLIYVPEQFDTKQLFKYVSTTFLPEWRKRK